MMPTPPRTLNNFQAASPTLVGLRPQAPTDTQQLLSELSNSGGGADGCHSELSGFDGEMMATEEMNEILESRNRSLIEHMLVLSCDKLTKWTKEMRR